MGDPVFSTRAELEAWVKSGLFDMAWTPQEWPLVLERIRRVVAAHKHLEEK